MITKKILVIFFLCLLFCNIAQAKECKGSPSGEKKITIEQDGSTFRGTVVTRAGVKNIIGSIASDNEHFVYVHVGDMGHAEGRILGKNRIETCYVHPGKNAVAGCSVSSREQ